MMCGVCPEEECFEGGVDCEDEAAGRTQQRALGLLHRAETDLRVQIEGGHLRSAPDGEDEVVPREEEEAGLAAAERRRPRKVAKAATRLLLLGREERDKIPLRGWIPRSSNLTMRCDSERRRPMRLL